MNQEDQDEMLTRIDENIIHLKSSSTDQEGRIRDLESFKGQAKGVMGALLLMKAWVVTHLFGGAS